MTGHAEHCGEHGTRCDCGGALICEGCHTHGGTYLWGLRCESCSKRTHYETYRYLLEPVVAERPSYDHASRVFTTPRGNTALMHYRQNTNDWNTIYASMTEDEYGLKSLPPLSGFAIDIGAYVGSVGIALAVDNPDLRVLCVEPVPANAALIAQNIKVNGVEDRVGLIQAAAGGPHDKETTVDWGYVGEPHLEHHAFVGNTTLVYEYGSNPTYEHQATVAECYSLSRLLRICGVQRLTLLKVDCEGCEWCVLTDSAVDWIDRVVGEWHHVGSRDVKPSHAAIRALLPNHDLTFSGPEAGPGGFLAVHR